VSELIESIRKALPHGNTLDGEDFERRHRAILVLLAFHVVAIPVFAVVQGYSVGHGLFEVLFVAVPAMVAAWGPRNRRVRAVAASIGLLSASAVITHVSGGMIEAHFHFFVMMPIVAFYHDWIPFLVAVGYVVIHHGAMGAIDPGGVYNHYAAFNNPWKWAAIHGLFILGISVVCIVTWRLNEIALNQQRLAEDDLRDTLSVLTGTLEATDEGILVVNRHGRWTTFNQRFVEMWSIPDDLVEARDSETAIDHLSPQLVDPDGFAGKIRDLYGSPDAESLDEIEFLDGRVFERTSKPHRVAGEAVGRVWTFRDITERKRSEVALREAVERLEARDESKNLFLTAVSHELRTPLAAVVGFAHTLRDHDANIPGEQRREFLGRLVNKANRLDGLLMNLLDLDRLTRGILEPRRQLVELHELCRRVVEIADVRAHRVAIAVDEIETFVDVAMVERIMENLLANAVKHTPLGGSIEVAGRADGSAVLLTVTDAGPGVRDDLKPVVFDPFVRGDDEAPSPGTGVGLALVAQFAELHGGRAWVEDAPGGGSAFRVLLADAVIDASERAAERTA